MQKIIFIGILKALMKGFTVIYLLYLPLLLSLKIISPLEVGILGFALMAGSFLNSVLMSLFSHHISRKNTYRLALALLTLTTLIFFATTAFPLLFLAYLMSGFGIGLSINMSDEISGSFTTKGSRFKAIGNIPMIQDTARVIYPTVVGIAFAGYALWGVRGVLVFSLITTLAVTLYLIERLDLRGIPDTKQDVQNPLALVQRNSSFRFHLLLELLDAFASSQLFVFLPMLLATKGFSIESAVGLQSLVFVGYLSGRWIVTRLADRFSGYAALALAEFGMAVIVFLLIILPPTILLYPLFVLLGIFTRGTSPVIKSLILDSLNESERRQGIPIYSLLGDLGAGVSPLFFGFVLSLWGSSAPFWISLFVAGIVCLLAASALRVQERTNSSASEL